MTIFRKAEKSHKRVQVPTLYVAGATTTLAVGTRRISWNGATREWSLIYLHSIRPLPTIKQIFTMFFSLHTEQFREVHQELVSFLLNKDSKYLPPKYRVFVYYTGDGRPRYSPTSAQISLGRSVLVMAELAFPPFGYVLTYGDKAPDSRMVEISHFARYDYAESAVLELRPPVLPTHLAFPGDYRTREQISRGMQENARFEQAAE